MNLPLNKDWIRAIKMAVVPLIFLAIAASALTMYMIRSQDSDLRAFDVPETKDSFELVEFMREMDASNPQDTWELKNSFAAIKKAAAIIQADPNADPADLREAEYFRLFAQWRTPASTSTLSNETEFKQLTSDTLSYLRGSNLDRRDGRLFGFFLTMLPQSGHPKVGLSACNELEDWLLELKDNKAQLGSLEIVAGTKRQLETVGNFLELESRSIEGEPFRIEDYEGKVVYLEFWTTTCGPCKADFPPLKQIYETHRDRGFEIVGISLDRSSVKVRKFIEDQRLPWVQLWHDRREGNEAIETRFAINAVPTTMLLDRKGRVVALNIRPEADSPEQDLDTWLNRM